MQRAPGRSSSRDHAIKLGAASVAEHHDRITGYATMVGSSGTVSHN
jgi:hypothetical protein